MSKASAVDVLVVGAGPTGLVLALWLTRLGVRVRIIDKTAAPGTTSRALAVHARTLEFYNQMGLADAVVERAWKALAANVWVGGKRKARAVFGEMGAGLSPYPYPLLFAQDEHELLLIERLAEYGVQVERERELVGFDQSADRVQARVRDAAGSEERCEAGYLAGCDGSHSAVRAGLGIGFPGGTYEHLFYVADIRGAGPTMNGELHVDLEGTDFLAVFPLKGRGRARLVGIVRQSAATNHELSWNDISTAVLDQMHIEVDEVNWFSTYHVHHRVAAHFRQGRAFLLGDAAHVHSPVGGQGMNTGIGDAVNLAWKLAAVVHQRMHPSVLDTYEPERIAFARRLVETTDRAFTSVTSRSALARFVRLVVVPALLPRLVALAAVRRAMFRTVSQTAINYRRSSLSAGTAGTVHGGDRLPWLNTDAPSDNFTPLRSLDWQVHVYGDPSAALQALCGQRRLALHVFPWRPGTAATGLRRDALYLVRPDGYVALADADGRAEAVAAYFDARSSQMPH